VKAVPRRGDVYWVALDPTRGSEVRKTRPAVIVSNDSCNRYGMRVVQAVDDALRITLALP